MTYKFSHILSAAVALTAFTGAMAESEILRKNYFDVRDKNIGFDINPIPADNGCLLTQAINGQTTTIYRNSAVQPTIAVNPSNKKFVVAAFDEGIISNNGSLDIGIATSNDGGKHFSDMVFPFQNCIGGIADRSGDAWLSYGPDGTLYLVANLTNVNQDINTLNQSGIVAAYSNDNGLTWSNPRWLTASQDFYNETTLVFPVADKPSVTADPNNPSTAYAVWNQSPNVASGHSDALKSCTFDGGITWCPQQTIYNPFNDTTFALINNGISNNMSVENNIIVVLPNGNLLNFMVRQYALPGITNEQYVNDVWPWKYRFFDIAFVQSADQGATWTTNATLVTVISNNEVFTGGYTTIPGGISGGAGSQMSTESLAFSVAVNPENGYIYVAWQSADFSINKLPQIAMKVSRDGGATWSASARVSTTPLNAPNPQAFTPAIAVAEGGYVGLLYQDFREDVIPVPTTNPATRTDIWFAEYKETVEPDGGSTGIGLDLVNSLRVSKNSYIMQIGPDTLDGIMTNGDYNSLAALGDDYYAAYVKTNNCPLMPEQTIFDEPDTSTILILDNNKRTSPFFSRIDSAN